MTLLPILCDADQRRELFGHMLHQGLDPRETTLPQLVAWLSVHEEYVPDDAGDGSVTTAAHNGRR